MNSNLAPGTLATGRRLEGKVAIVVGAGQTSGDTIGNGRATAVLFARQGAKVMCVDKNLVSAAETVELIRSADGEASACEADIAREEDCTALVRATVAKYERIDILHNNVGIGAPEPDTVDLEEAHFKRILDVNLKGTFLTCKHVLPIMRKQLQGSVINMSSSVAVCSTPILAYKISKAGVNALTHSVAMSNARYNIRVNAIMAGLINTPMAIEGISKTLGISKDELIRSRDARVPLGAKMGTAWDVAYAALFFASDESRYITGAILPVDGGQSARIGE